jgi:hypothetical protein
MRKSNLATSLWRKVRSNPMQAYDALPPEARRWLASACFPWSPQSVARLWRRALRDANGCKHHAKGLDAAEQRLLERDAPKIWGKWLLLQELMPSSSGLNPPLFIESGRDWLRAPESAVDSSC